MYCFSSLLSIYKEDRHVALTSRSAVNATWRGDAEAYRRADRAYRCSRRGNGQPSCAGACCCRGHPFTLGSGDSRNHGANSYVFKFTYIYIYIYTIYEIRNTIYDTRYTIYISIYIYIYMFIYLFIYIYIYIYIFIELLIFEFINL